MKHIEDIEKARNEQSRLVFWLLDGTHKQCKQQLDINHLLLAHKQRPVATTTTHISHKSSKPNGSERLPQPLRQRGEYTDN